LRPVNLLPARYRPTRASGERPGVAYAAVGVLAVLLLMIVLYVVTNNGINDAKSKTAEAQAQTQAAQAKIGQLQGYGSFASLKQARLSAVQGIAESRFDWERLMREMALVLPHNTYLTAFSASPGGATTTASTGTATATGPSITLTGCAPTHNAVATAIVRLRKMHNVVDVELTSSNRAAAGPNAAGNPCATQWNATVTMQAESAPTASAVPARLGGGQ
jgi:Tfp pilus assembly protein PilN